MIACLLLYALYPILYALSPMPFAPCAMPSALCLLPFAFYLMPFGLSPLAYPRQLFPRQHIHNPHPADAGLYNDFTDVIFNHRSNHGGILSIRT